MEVLLMLLTLLRMFLSMVMLVGQEEVLEDAVSRKCYHSRSETREGVSVSIPSRKGSVIPPSLADHLLLAPSSNISSRAMLH